MPNWITNRVIVEGSQTKKLLKFIGEKVDFQKIIPMPKELEGTKAPTDSPNTPENKVLREKYGADNWYEWCVHNWGVKWNAAEVDIFDEEIKRAGSFPMVEANELLFNTPWHCPYPIFDKLIEMFPRCKLTVIWYDEDDDERNIVTYKGDKYND